MTRRQPLSIRATAAEHPRQSVEGVPSVQAPYQQSYNEDASHSHRPLSHQEIANSHALNTLPNLRKILLDRANEDMQSSPPMYNLHDMPEQVQIHPSHRETLIERVNDEDARYHPQLGSHQSWHERTGVVPTTEREAGPEKPADPTSYAQPFMKFITENPTVYHAVDNVRQHLQHAGFQELSERESWDNLEHEGAYFVKRNNSSIIAFRVGNKYKPGNGASIIATHIDALATRLKPVSSLPTKEGYVQLGVAPYAGALNGTWWDRDLGIGGRVIVRDNKTHKITQRLVKLDYPIARIPTLAPHFGQAANLGGANKETEMVPIVGLDNSDLPSTVLPQRDITSSSNVRSFTSTQPPRLVSAISKALPLHSQEEIINWDLELFDTQPAQLGGIDKDLIFAPRVDDKLCSWCAIEALTSASATQSPNTLNVVACFDDEEIGSRLRQGAHSNFLPETLSRIASVFCGAGGASAETIGRTYANSFLVSADVSHAVNPNFLGSYLPNHSPRLNVGVAVQADPDGHTTTDAVSTAFLQRIANKCGQQLQVFQIRNDSRSGGTVGPMLSSKMGMRAIDAGLPQLSMHSIRATIGNKDPGLGVILFRGFFEGFEAVDEEFRS